MTLLPTYSSKSKMIQALSFKNKAEAEYIKKLKNK